MKQAKKEILKNSFIMSSAAIIGKIFAIPVSIIAAHFLGPTLLGVNALIGVFRQYLAYTHMGLLYALSRDVPIAYGKGDMETAQHIPRIVLTGVCINMCIGLISVWILFWIGMWRDLFDAMLLLLVTVIIVFNNIQSYLRTYAKAEGLFIYISRFEMVTQLLSPILMIPGIIYFQLHGILVTTLILQVLGCFLYFTVLRNIQYSFLFDLWKMVKLIKTGMLIFINKIAEAIFMSIDLMIIAALLPIREVGYYSVALVAVRLNEVFFGGFNMIIYRKIMFEGGKRGTDDKTHFRKYFEHYFIVYLLLSAILIGCAVLFYVFLARTVLLRYQPSIVPMMILAFGYLFFSARFFVSTYLNVTNQLHKRIGIITMGLVVNALFDVILIKAGYGLVGVASACSFSFIMITIWLIIYASKQIYNTIKEGFFICLRIFICSAVLVSVIAIFYFVNIFNYEVMDNILMGIGLGMCDMLVKVMIYAFVALLIFVCIFNEFSIHLKLWETVTEVFWLIKKRLTVCAANADTKS